MGKLILLGKTDGNITKGRTLRTWIDQIIEVTQVTLQKLYVRLKTSRFRQLVSIILESRYSVMSETAGERESVILT